MSIEEALAEARNRFRASDALIPFPGRPASDAAHLMEFVLGREPIDGETLDGATARRYRRFVDRHAAGEPIGYITGRVTFLDLTLEMRRGVFVPRDSSELTVKQAVLRLRRRTEPVLVDLGSGAGPITLAVAKAIPRARVFGVDLSPAAVRLARWNAARLHLANVTFLAGDLYAPVPARLRGGVDIITAHPPYVPKSQIRRLYDEIRLYEPDHTLTDFSRTGMSMIERIAEGASVWLKPRGWLLVQIASSLSRRAVTTLSRAGLKEVRIVADGAGSRAKFTCVVAGRR